MRCRLDIAHLRLGREIKLANALTFMANERVASEDAVAGDIIGIHNHGQLQIGDTLRLADLTAPDGATFVDDPEETVIATVAAPRVEEEPEVEEGEELAEGEEAPAGEGAPEAEASADEAAARS